MGRFLAFRGNKQAFVEASRAAEKTAHTHILDLLLGRQTTEPCRAMRAYNTVKKTSSRTSAMRSVPATCSTTLGQIMDQTPKRLVSTAS